MIKKNAQVANFNIVFGDQEFPMLDYFDTIVFPALTSGIAKVSNDNKYLFMNIGISKNKSGVYTLTGILVKKTIVEIKSDLTEEGQLIEKDEKYSTAPYSSFAINLRNHRMLFIPNQKGSPSIATFKSTLQYVIETYIITQNMGRDEEKRLPTALVKVVGIPSAKTMDELLDNVEKINSLTLRFYPLNGDIDYTEAFGFLTTEMRKDLGCKNGEIVFKSPKRIDGVKKLLEKAAGTIDPIIKVITKTGSKATLKSDELSEKYELTFNDEADIGQDGTQLVERMSNIESLTFTNENHNEIYNRNIDKINSVQ